MSRGKGAPDESSLAGRTQQDGNTRSSEISGTPDAFCRAIQLCAPGGRIVLTGLLERDFPTPSTPIVRKELTVQDSMIYRDEFPAAIGLLARGEIDTTRLISGAYPLEEILPRLRGPSIPKPGEGPDQDAG